MAKPSTNPPTHSNAPVAPIAGDDTLAAVVSDPSNSTTVSARTLLANDTDRNADVLTITAVQPGTGIDSVELSADHSTVTFAVTPDFAGKASFSYIVFDGHKGTDIGGVTVPVTAPTPPEPEPEPLFIRFLPTQDTVEEGRPLVFTVDIGTTRTTNTTLHVTTQGSSATAGSDYSALYEGGGRDIVVPAGQRTADIVIGTVDDTILEPREQFTVTVAESGVDPYVGSSASIAGFITDNTLFG